MEKQTIKSISRTEPGKIYQYILLILLCVAWIAFAYYYIQYTNKHNLTLYLQEEIADTSKTAEEEYLELDTKYQTEVAKLQLQIETLQTDLNKAKADYDTLKSEYTTVSGEYTYAEKKLKLYDDYSYALYDTEGYRNDLTVELLELGDSLMKAENLDPNILFGIIMIESEGHADCIDPTYDASGLGQFLESSGEFVCSRLMDEEIDYDHSTTPFDPEINIRMMVVYLSYLFDKYDGSSFDAIQQYCGGSDANAQRYYTKLSRIIGYNP